MARDDNGMLASVGGSDIAEASHVLPPATTAEDRIHDVVIEAGHVGHVKIYFRRQFVRHNKHSHWFWLAVRAEAVEPPASP